MPQHRDGQRIAGVQRTPGHLDKADLNGGGQAMVIPVARENGRTHRGGEGKEIADFECCELRRTLILDSRVLCDQ